MKTHELTVERTTDSGADALILRLRGVLGETNACFQLLEEIRRDVAKLPKRILVNLKGVERLTSPGIGVLAACFTTAKNAGRSLVLVGLGKTAKSSLDATGLGSVFPQFATEADALKAR